MPGSKAKERCVNDNQSFKKWLSDMVFNITYNTEGKPFTGEVDIK